MCAAASKKKLARPRQEKNCLSRMQNIVNYDQMCFSIRLENPPSGSHKKVSLYLLSNNGRQSAPDQDCFTLLHVNLMQTFLIYFLRPYASRRSQSTFFAVDSRCILSPHKSREDVSTKDGERDIFIKIMIQPWSEHKKFLLFRREIHTERQTTNCKSHQPIYIKGMLSVGFVSKHITLRPGLSLPATCGDGLKNQQLLPDWQLKIKVSTSRFKKLHVAGHRDVPDRPINPWKVMIGNRLKRGLYVHLREYVAKH